MDARTAKREACWIASQLIDSYLGVGQPFYDFEEHGKPERDAQRVYDALVELREEFGRRGHTVFAPTSEGEREHG